MEQHAHPAVHMKTVDDWGCVDLFKDIYIYISFGKIIMKLENHVG